VSRLDRHLSAAAGHAADADEPPDGSWAAALPLLAAAAQRRRPELAVLRLGDGSLLPAGARNTTCLAAWSGPASSACAVLPLLSVQLIDVLTTGEPARKYAGLSRGLDDWWHLAAITAPGRAC
jgi:hypothetical protein